MGNGTKLKYRTGCLIVLLSVALSLVNMTGGSAVLAEEVDLASIVRGGQLYDNWIEELRQSQPLKPHPSYPATGKYKKNAQATWRCKECHGWDYLGRNGTYGKGEHFTGIIGIQGMVGASPEQIIAVLTDDTHRYKSVFYEQELLDLANFVSRGQIDMDKYIDRRTNSARGDANSGKVFFNTICANCHGKDGQKNREIQSLGTITSLNPWESIHKILNGHPGETMPALRAFDMDILIGIIAYAQTLPKEDTLSSIVRGGRLYDNWYAETQKPKPQEAHPAYPKFGQAIKSTGATWRCKECHGWDYRGRTGNYSKGIHHTGIKGIRRATGMSTNKVIAIISDETHGYTTKLSSQDLRDLANFVSKGQVDMDQVIDSKTGAAKGKKGRNIDFYVTICATCHGPRGLKVITLEPLGHLAVTHPWAAYHTLLNGHPGEEMPALRVLETNVLADILTYIQSLPTRR